MKMNKGLYNKYGVSRTDGKPVTDCFVLEPEKDSDAIVPVLLYGLLTDNPILLNDLLKWVGEKWRQMKANAELDAKVREFVAERGYATDNKSVACALVLYSGSDYALTAAKLLYAMSQVQALEEVDDAVQT